MFLYEFCSYYCIVLLLIREVVGGQGLGIITRLLLGERESKAIRIAVGLTRKTESIPRYLMALAAMYAVQPLKRIKKG